MDQLEVGFGIPKFHLPAHGSKCWSLFSLNFLRGWARIDGEAIERVWAAINGVTTSTREMSPGARHDYLDDQWNAANFRKLVNLGELINDYSYEPVAYKYKVRPYRRSLLKLIKDAYGARRNWKSF